MRKKMKILILAAAATIATSLALPAAADAYYYGYGYPYYGFGFGFGHGFHGYGGYGYGPYGYGGFAVDGSLRIEVNPKDAREDIEVYVDGRTCRRRERLRRGFPEASSLAREARDRAQARGIRDPSNDDFRRAWRFVPHSRGDVASKINVNRSNAWYGSRNDSALVPGRAVQ